MTKKQNDYYQRKKYRINEDAYRTAKQTIKNYERLMREKRGQYFVDAIERALETVPKEYRKGVMGKLVKSQGFPLDSSLNNYYLWCAVMVRKLAEELDLVEKSVNQHEK